MFSAEQPGRGPFRAQRALLALWRPVESPIGLMTFYRFLALVTAGASLCADVGIHDAQAGQPGQAPWLLYGTSAAQLNMLFYYALALRLSMYKTLPFADVTTTPEPLTPLGRACWATCVSGTTCLCAAFLVYEAVGKLPGRRASEEPVLAVNLFFALGNVLFGNTPWLPKQVAAPLGQCALYLASLAFYEATTGQALYSISLGNLAFLLLVAVLASFFALLAMLEVRNIVAPSYVWITLS